MKIAAILVIGIIAINLLSKALVHEPASFEARKYGCGGMLVSIVVLLVAGWVVVYGGGL